MLSVLIKLQIEYFNLIIIPIKFYDILILFYYAALLLAAEKDNYKIVKLLLSNSNINVNIQNILNNIFLLYSKSNTFMVLLSNVLIKL